MHFNVKSTIDLKYLMEIFVGHKVHFNYYFLFIHSVYRLCVLLFMNSYSFAVILSCVKCILTKKFQRTKWNGNICEVGICCYSVISDDDDMMMMLWYWPIHLKFIQMHNYFQQQRKKKKRLKLLHLFKHRAHNQWNETWKKKNNNLWIVFFFSISFRWKNK